QIGIDGYRLDFVRGFQAEYAADWVNNLPLKNGEQPFIVGEYWGPGYRLEEWVDDLAGMGADADVFDFPLREDLKRICMDDNYEMHWLNQAGMVRGPEFNLPGNSVVTWLDNHDTGKEWDKWVTRDWWMAYAYMLTHEGRPCLFYPHYYGGTLESGHNGIHKQITVPSMKGAIDDLMFIRRTYLGGTLEVLTATGNPWPSDNTRNVYVARRQGNGVKDGGIVVMNNSYQTKGVWVTVNASGFSNWSNKTLVNAFTGETTPVYSDGRAWLEAPQRGYSVYVLQSDYTPISDPAVEPKSVETPGEIVPAVADFNLSVYPNPVNAAGSLTINSKTDVNVTVDIYNKMGQNVAKLYQGELNAGVNSFSLSNYELSAGTYFVKVSNGSNVITSQLVIL
ncbi:MAG: T9SS type A sorting domain-containing protein, partial [Bacteroidales bacterium]|nr:T9SS type A sorting domain-containing protein [Bacteroidales bacterium]